MIEEEGLDDVFARHALLARATRAGAAGARASSCSATPTSAPPSSPRSSCRTTIDGGKVPGAPAQARHHRQRRPGPAQGQDPAHRPLRLLRRVRHPHVAVRPRDGARRSSATRSSSAPASAPPSRSSSRPASRAAGVSRSPSRYRDPRQGEDRRLRRRPPARALRRRPRRRLDRRGARRAHRRLRRHPDPLGHASSTADLIEPRRQPEGDRPRRRRRRQRRRRGGHQARHHRRQRAAVEHRRRRRAHGRADARARAQHPAGARRRSPPASGSARSSAASRSTRRRSASSASAASASSSPPRAQGFGMHVVAFDPFVVGRALPRARRREGRVARRRLRARPTSSRIHLPKTPETRGWLDAEAFAKMQGRRARHQLRARRAARRRGAQGRARLRQGRGRRARRLPDASRSPTTRCSTATPTSSSRRTSAPRPTEAQDRAGVQTAEQVVAALTGGVVSTAVNIPADQRGGHGGARPVPAARASGSAGSPTALAEGSTSTASRSSTSAASPSATRACSRSPCSTACSPATPRRRSTSSTRRRWPRSAGSRSSETQASSTARDFTDLVRVTVVSGDERVRVVGTTLGRRHRPHLLEAWGQRFNLQLDDATSRCSATPTCPGMIGRVGTRLRRARHQHLRGRRRPPGGGQRRPRGDGGHDRRAVPQEVVDEIVASDGFVAGRALPLRDSAPERQASERLRRLDRRGPGPGASGAGPARRRRARTKARRPAPARPRPGRTRATPPRAARTRAQSSRPRGRPDPTRARRTRRRRRDARLDRSSPAFRPRG